MQRAGWVRRVEGVVDENNLSWQFQLQGQSAVVSRQQAREAGFTEAAIKWRLRSGQWRRFIDKPIGPIHVSVPAERRPGRRKIRGVVIHRARCLVPQWQPPWQLPRTTVEDTVLDLVARARTFDDAYGWISAAVGRRLTSAELLSKALAGRSRIRWRAWITAALQDAADGVHSPLERNYVYGVERAHGPTPPRTAAGPPRRSPRSCAASAGRANRTRAAPPVQ